MAHGDAGDHGHSRSNAYRARAARRGVAVAAREMTEAQRELLADQHADRREMATVRTRGLLALGSYSEPIRTT